MPHVLSIHSSSRSASSSVSPSSGEEGSGGAPGAHDDCRPRPDDVEDCEEVADLRLQIGQRRMAVRQPCRTHVVPDYASERVEFFRERANVGMLPLHLQSALEGVKPQDVDRAVADDVISQMHTVRRFRVAGLRNFHANMVA